MGWGGRCVGALGRAVVPLIAVFLAHRVAVHLLPTARPHLLQHLLRLFVLTLQMGRQISRSAHIVLLLLLMVLLNRDIDGVMLIDHLHLLLLLLIFLLVLAGRRLLSLLLSVIGHF